MHIYFCAYNLTIFVDNFLWITVGKSAIRMRFYAVIHSGVSPQPSILITASFDKLLSISNL